MKGIAVTVLTPADLPELPEHSLKVANEAGAPEFKVEGRGHVENP